MLLPDKHITFAESLLGLGAYVLETLSTPMTIDQVWRSFEKSRGADYPAFHSFDNLVLAVDSLYALGILSLNEDGKLSRYEVSKRHATN
ncbi:ABC-three component system middle component 6 [Herbaspirillum sp. 1130]|uniref:ABC-three component system middle component 6 n=1 Tax=Herbaspirillum sp. 1130 TaxID=2806562 RepID=UPI001AE5CA32|nr:ABC-three component system middle component 6 [Herbaspirillum sp. 1130]MBP1315268.1 hypothetical protein [Herbaspirillum sp. 1130]